MRIRLFPVAFVFFAVTLYLVGPAFAEDKLTALARQAVSKKSSESAAAMAALRSAGPAGLDALFEVHAEAIQRNTSNLPQKAALSADESWERLTVALDTVGQQRDCYASHLYWYTDLEQAKAAAKASGKPILSLRLLGKLNEEFSCANSRFFRTVLYANADVSQYLREHFILHWKSVRPVPRVTIDFGDGRKLERTLTGNSIHYILATDGRVLDGLPGLYGPQAFLRKLRETETIATQCSQFDDQARENILVVYHNTRSRDGKRPWAADLKTLGKSVPSAFVAPLIESQAAAVRSPKLISEQKQAPLSPPSANEAAPIALTKRKGGEGALLRTITYFDIQALENTTDAAMWEKIAGLHLEDAKLDGNSVTLMRRHNPYVCESPKAKSTHPLTDEQLAQIVQTFERNIATDTVRNEYLLHTKLHEWLAQSMKNADVETLNEKVYAELFLTPSSDPWLGLVSPGIYTALENDGIVK